MDDADNEFFILGDLAEIKIGRQEKRPICDQCSRPKAVCWCQNVNISKLKIKSNVVLLQHPHEEKKCLRTAPILEAFLPQDNFITLKGKKFTPNRFPELKEIFNNPNSIILYPGKEAKPIHELPTVSATQVPYNIIIIDGTWQQAKSMFYRNLYLKDLKQVCLAHGFSSEYVIRTQPTEEALSTVETAAIALSTLENDWSIYDSLIQPLKLICNFQMTHGAVKHESKERRILTHSYNKPMGKRTYKKLRKCGVNNENKNVKEIINESAKRQVKQDEEKKNDD